MATSSYGRLQSDLTAWSLPSATTQSYNNTHGNDVYVDDNCPSHSHNPSYLPTPPASSDSSSSSDSDLSSSPDGSPTCPNLPIPSSPPPPYSTGSFPSPPSSPTMIVQSHHRRQSQSRPIPKPILTNNPFPSYNPRRSHSASSSSTSNVTFAQPTSPITRPRLPLHSITESSEEPLDGFLGHAANGDGTAGNDGEEMIGDDEYDCGWAMDLGAGSPSISGSPAPGGQPDFGSSSFSSFSSSSSSSPSTPPHEEPATIASDQLGQSLSRRMTITNDPTVASPAKANGAGAVYKRDTEEETGDRLLREWAVAVAGKGEVVTPSVPSSTTVGRRSRGASVSQQLPPLSCTHNRSRSSSRSGRRGSVSTSNATSPSTSKTVWTDPADRDCGICFEYAVKPARTMCCGKIFCKEHLDDVSVSFLRTALQY